MPRVELKAEVCLLEQMRATRTVLEVEEVQQICDGAVAEDQEQCCCAGEVPCSVVKYSDAHGAAGVAVWSHLSTQQ